MARPSILSIGLTALAVVLLLDGPTLRAQDAQSEAALASLAGKYQGITEAHPVKAPAFCELRFDGGKVVGTLQLGHELLLVSAGSLSGDALILALDVNGREETFVGVFKDGRLEGRALGETIVMTKVDPAKRLAWRTHWAPVPGWRF